LNRLDAGSVYRLKNEFRALADVTHPNLVRLHELFAQDASWFFTMELVDGERFDHWVRPDDALDEARLRAALTQLVAGVSAIHSAGKLHRDLKPSNVLVTPEGRVVVLDFGLAVDPELGGVGQTVAEDSVSGTPAYMAPEQAAGKPATQASDFYALGVMLFEALTGRLPFEGRSGEMLAAKQTRDAPSASAVWKRAPCRASPLRAPMRLGCVTQSALRMGLRRRRAARAPAFPRARRSSCSAAKQSSPCCGGRIRARFPASRWCCSCPANRAWARARCARRSCRSCARRVAP
jgi:serine/threonine protein kinase